MPIEHDALPSGPESPAVWAAIVEGPPEGVERALRHVQGQLLANYRGQPGWRGTVGLISFDRRQSLVLSYWESEAALRENSADIGRFREGAAALGVTITRMDRFEMLFDERVE